MQARKFKLPQAVRLLRKTHAWRVRSLKFVDGDVLYTWHFDVLRVPKVEIIKKESNSKVEIKV